MKIAFTGRRALGGVKMRGVDVAKRLGVPFYDLRDLPTGLDTVVLVKYWFDKRDNHAVNLRRSCERLIFDPLDCWSSLKKHRETQPAAFWRWTRRVLDWDEIIATSPACAETMAGAVHLLPHHADPRVGPDWYNPRGHVAYSGGLRFIAEQFHAIDAACKRLGRKLRVDHKNDLPSVYHNAALALHLRLPPEDTPLNRHCKPQVKLENAAASGLPCLATDHPCVNTMKRATVYHTDGIDWKTAIAMALDWTPLSTPFTLDDHCNRLAPILNL